MIVKELASPIGGCDLIHGTNGAYHHLVYVSSLLETFMQYNTRLIKVTMLIVISIDSSDHILWIYCIKY